VKVAGRWRDVYRAIDQFGQVIDVFVAERRDAKAARCFFVQRAIATTAIIPVEVVTDQAAAYPAVLDELVPAAWHRTSSTPSIASRPTTAVSRRDCDRCAGSSRTAVPRSSSPGMPFCRTSGLQNIWRAHYELAVDEPVTLRLAVAFDELARAI
jgi:transposase, IS6 family